MIDADLLRHIRLGEDGRLEYMRIFFSGGRVTEPRSHRVADTLASFANGRGGTFVLGVDDGTREIVGVILRESQALSGRPPEYTLIDESDLRLVIWSATPAAATSDTP